MAATRLFIALFPPAIVRAELAALAGPLAGMGWTPEEDFHLTLRFIGDTAPEKLEKFAESLTRVRVESFLLPVAGVGLFPSRGPAAGVGHAHPRLFQLRKQVDEALLTVDGGLEVRHFHPHFTLGRQKTFEAPPFRVNEFQLMASEPQPGQPAVYRPVRTYPLLPR